MPDVKKSPSICLCLSPAFFAFCPFPTLFTLHIPFGGCYLEQWFHLLQKTVPHLFGSWERKKKTSAVVILFAISIFSVIISNIQRREGGRQLFDSALSYLPNTKLKWMLLTLSQLHESHLNKPLLLFFISLIKILFLTVHQPSFDPLECIMHSQIKRTWQGINKQPHYLLLRDASIRLLDSLFEAYTSRHLLNFYVSRLFIVYLPSYCPLGMSIWSLMFKV